MKKLRAAVIGWGRSGRDIHGRHLHTDTERFEVAAVVDELPRRRELAREEFGCETLADYRELFGRTDLDLVINASFSHQHAPITADLLNHGFNVLCEKPCAKTEAQVRELMDIAARTGKMLAVFQQSRLVPYFEKVRQVLDSGVLGRVIEISIRFNGFSRRWDWQCCQSFNAGSLYNTGPHPVDQALALLDFSGVPDVICRMDRVNTFGDAEDYVKLILTAPGKPLIDLEISSCDAYPSFTYKVQGSRGGLKGTQTEIEWRYFDEGEAPSQRLVTTPLMDEEGKPAYCKEKLTWTEEHWKSDGPRVFTYAVRRYYDSIYRHLTEGAPLIVTLEQIRQQIAVMEICHRQNPLSRFAD